MWGLAFKLALAATLSPTAMVAQRCWDAGNYLVYGSAEGRLQRALEQQNAKLEEINQRLEELDKKLEGEKEPEVKVIVLTEERLVVEYFSSGEQKEFKLVKEVGGPSKVSKESPESSRPPG